MRLDINITKLTVNKLSLTLLPFNCEYSPLYAANYDFLKLRACDELELRKKGLSYSVHITTATAPYTNLDHNITVL